MIKIELLSDTNFCIESLDLYNRKQDVNKVYRRIDRDFKTGGCFGCSICTHRACLLAAYSRLPAVTRTPQAPFEKGGLTP